MTRMSIRSWLTVSAISLAALGLVACDTDHRGRILQVAAGAALHRSQGRACRRRLREGDQAVRAPRRPRRRHAAGAAGACSSAPTCSGRPPNRRRRWRRSSASSSCIPPARRYDYALYLQGLINFNDNLGFFGSLAAQDLSERDQQASRDAYQSFRQLTERFPQSSLRRGRAAAHGLHRQLARRLRGPRRALLLPARRLRGRGQPGAAGGAGVPAARRRPRKRSTSWRRATTASA